MDSTLNRVEAWRAWRERWAVSSVLTMTVFTLTGMWLFFVVNQTLDLLISSDDLQNKLYPAPSLSESIACPSMCLQSSMVLLLVLKTLLTFWGLKKANNA